MKIKTYKLKDKHILASQFNPPRQIPKGVYDAYQTHNDLKWCGFVNINPEGPGTSGVRQIYPKDYVLYRDETPFMIIPESAFDDLFKKQ